MPPTASRKAPIQKTQNVCKIIGIQELQKRRIGTKNGIHGNAGKNNAHWIDAAAPGHKVDQDAGKKGAHKSYKRHKRKPTGEKEHDRRCSRCCPCRDPDDAWIGQRVSHNSLKQGPSKGEGHANHDGQKDTRQAKPNNNDAGHAIFFKEAFEDLSRRNIGAANSQGKNGKNAKCDEKRQKYETSPFLHLPAPGTASSRLTRSLICSTSSRPPETAKRRGK